MSVRTQVRVRVTASVSDSARSESEGKRASGRARCVKRGAVWRADACTAMLKIVEKHKQQPDHPKHKREKQ